MKFNLDYLNSPTWALARTVCEKNDTTLMDQAILATSQQDDLDDLDDLEQLYGYNCRHAIQNNSTNVLTHLIEHGVSVKTLRPTTVVGNRRTSKAILEILLAHGSGTLIRAMSRDQARTLNLLCGMLLTRATWLPGP
jgi:hypothetical protein